MARKVVGEAKNYWNLLSKDDFVVFYAREEPKHECMYMYVQSTVFEPRGGEESLF